MLFLKILLFTLFFYGKLHSTTLLDHTALPEQVILDLSKAPVGVMVIDPGLKHTTPQTKRSDVSRIDAENSKLYYHQIPVENLINENIEFEKLGCWLIYPDQKKVKEDIFLNKNLKSIYYQSKRVLKTKADPYLLTKSMIDLYGAQHLDKKSEDVLNDITSIYPLVLIANHQEQSSIKFDNSLPIKENFFRIMNFDHNKKNIFNTLMILHLAHSDSNLSNFVGYSIHSGQQVEDSFSTKQLINIISGGMSALAGENHGAANMKVFEMFKKIDAIPELTVEKKVSVFLDNVEQKKDLLWGYGHRIYKKEDPRAQIIKNLNRTYNENHRYMPIVHEIEKQTAQREYFKKRKIIPNIDFYTGLLFDYLGFYENEFTLLFSWARTYGSVAHEREHHEYFKTTHQSIPLVRPPQYP